ncbi:hypothetical protein OIU80_11495 [Flavobacterium sp. LS1R47]|uniref:Uncharacterized protein n=1 Tax=Flavobacterium frigoritolerans TaxID=2987686 RepID=A0A9X3C6Y5_9FLAO|nr:hypothetical protein [Flavobacterium frigoritolerans]MCV9932909.1 hypothetical protein [Flavobacterium frigoritolerans]
MTKDLKRAAEKELNDHIDQIESVYSELQSQSILEEKKQVLNEQFILEKEELAKFYKNLEEMESSKIWLRIHRYTEEFSKKNNYQLIMDFENTNSILDTYEKKVVNEELLRYINKRYEGLK